MLQSFKRRSVPVTRHEYGFCQIRSCFQSTYAIYKQIAGAESVVTKLLNPD